MKRSATVLLLASMVVLGSQAPALGVTKTGTSNVTTSQTETAAAHAELVSTTVATIPPARTRAPALQAPAPTVTTALPPRSTSTPKTTPVTLSATRAAYINAMYVAVVPAGQRAALAGRYVLGYNLPGLGCGTGCTGLFNGQARSSFNDTFFAESLAYQRNTLAHEAAHAYGYLYFTSYTTPSWAALDGWQAEFNRLDRSFVRTYDAEAWAACVAWQETGFNNRIDQITNICTPQAATAAMAQIP